jgi:hypothetical protein
MQATEIIAFERLLELKKRMAEEARKKGKKKRKGPFREGEPEQSRDDSRS